MYTKVFHSIAKDVKKEGFRGTRHRNCSGFSGQRRPEVQKLYTFVCRAQNYLLR